MPRAAAPLNDGVDLDADHRAAIEATFAELDDLDHYALLAVPRGADKKSIKRAYYEFASRYHPDRFFRKNLGPYRTKMEAIFARGTAAHDILTSKTGRVDYDAQIATSVESPRASDAAKASDAVKTSEATKAAPAIDPTPVAPVAITTPPPSEAQPVDAVSSSRPPVDPRARRDVLARRLLAGRTSRPPPPAPSSAPPSDGAVVMELRAQAARDESRGLWLEAAATWERIALLLANESLAFERSARALLAGRGDLNRAAELARRAVALAPRRASHRTTLATIYLAAGQYGNAKTELVAAQRLAPSDDTITELLKKVP